MKYTCGILFLSFFLPAVHSTKNHTIPFDNNWLPVIDTLESLNSSSIKLVWRPSPSLGGVDIDELSGNFTVSLYVASQEMFEKVIVYNADKLNTTDSITIAELTPDTAYQSCLRTKWYEQNDTIEVDSPRIFPAPKCRLLRTYAIGKLN